MNNIDDLRDRYDELENVVNTLEDLSNDIKYHKDIMEQIDSLRFDTEKEMEELGRELQKMEDAENKEQELEYGRSRF